MAEEEEPIDLGDSKVNELSFKYVSAFYIEQTEGSLTIQSRFKKPFLVHHDENRLVIDTTGLEEFSDFFTGELVEFGLPYKGYTNQYQNVAYMENIRNLTASNQSIVKTKAAIDEIRGISQAFVSPLGRRTLDKHPFVLTALEESVRDFQVEKALLERWGALGHTEMLFNMRRDKTEYLKTIASKMKEKWVFSGSSIHIKFINLSCYDRMDLAFHNMTEKESLIVFNSQHLNVKIEANGLLALEDSVLSIK